MKRFIKNIVLFSLLPLCLIVRSFFLADGTTDSFYLRFTTPQQESLILGTSRAAQDIQPAVVDSVLKRSNIHTIFFNYAFTLAHSPYGPVYYEAVKKKLDSRTKDGMYIISVDPWSISSNTKDPNDVTAFEENRLCLAKTKNINGRHPNIDYLINSYQKPLFSIYIDRLKNLVRPPTTILHTDGWLEVKVSMDPIEVKKRLSNKLVEYNLGFVPYYHFSSLRLAYLEKTIDLLNQHGSVYLVRLPVDTHFKQMDDALLPGFDSLMIKLSIAKKVQYLNYANDENKYAYTDGNHLYQDSGKDFSRKLAQAIAELQRMRITGSH